MALTAAQVNKKYGEAADALKEIMDDDDATIGQRFQAEQELRRLTHDFIDWHTDEIQKRTAAFREFVQNMRSVIATFGDDPLLEGLTTLRKVVAGAEKLLES